MEGGSKICENDIKGSYVLSVWFTVEISAICKPCLNSVKREGFPHSSEVRPKEHGW